MAYIVEVVDMFDIMVIAERMEQSEETKAILEVVNKYLEPDEGE